jgi:hypothetical protein
MPAWLTELIGTSPVLAGIGIVAYYVHKIVRGLIDSPLSIAAIFGVLGGKARREDAREMAKILCERPDDEPPAIEPPRRWRRRRKPRRKRR